MLWGGSSGYHGLCFIFLPDRIAAGGWGCGCWDGGSRTFGVEVVGVPTFSSLVSGKAGEQALVVEVVVVVVGGVPWAMTGCRTAPAEEVGSDQC